MNRHLWLRAHHSVIWHAYRADEVETADSHSLKAACGHEVRRVDLAAGPPPPAVEFVCVVDIELLNAERLPKPLPDRPRTGGDHDDQAH
ncbi:hypothetical protein UK23_29450 [Lentzea aerocolonigenes]|uniref:Uncharacterized protein n=1 Tax=Lentzea aerocolonigenes TaxID=68170 RepID=A0A0F0GLS0_LENAE|nr:hypothetical protein UK23_29450 [Lentzea aerocolonigenes]